MKFNPNQMLIAFGLFLLGYLTFNNPWFTDKKADAPPAVTAPSSAASAPAAAPAPAPAGPSAR